MKQVHDFLAKYILQHLLDARGSVVLQQETGVPDTQYIDAVFDPAGPHDDEGPRPPCCALLDRMTPAQTLLEPFSRSLSAPLLREALRKQLTYHHRLTLDARRAAAPAETPPAQAPTGPPAAPEATDPPSPPLPMLWLLCPGRPGFLFSDFGARPLRGWPRGFHGLPPGFHVRFVVLQQLPRTRETLPLRLLGDRRLRAQALKEQHAIPASDPDKPLLQSLVASLRIVLERVTPEKSEDGSAEMTWAMQELNRIREHERSQGRAMELRESIRALCTVLDIPLTPQRRDELTAASIDRLDQLRHHLLAHRAWP